MDTLDTPVQLKFNNGNLFFRNKTAILTSYIFIPFSLYIMYSKSLVLGIILLLVSLPVIFNSSIFEIKPEENEIHEYTKFLGFIKLRKKFQLSNYKYITAMPLIESWKTNSSLSNSNVESESFTALTMFKEHMKGKTIITKLKNKGEANNLGEALGNRLGLKFFEYDPVLIRQVLLGQKTL